MKKTYQLPVTEVVAIQLMGSMLDIDNQKFSDFTEGGDANTASTFEDEDLQFSSSTSLWDE